mgnify:FL=1
MKATISLEMDSLWQAIQSLSVKNKEWLCDKLVEDLRKEDETEYISKEEILAGIDAGLKEMVERKRCGRKAKALDALINEL